MTLLASVAGAIEYELIDTGLCDVPLTTHAQCEEYAQDSGSYLRIEDDYPRGCSKDSVSIVYSSWQDTTYQFGDYQFDKPLCSIGGIECVCIAGTVPVEWTHLTETQVTDGDINKTTPVSMWTGAAVSTMVWTDKGLTIYFKCKSDSYGFIGLHDAFSEPFDSSSGCNVLCNYGEVEIWTQGGEKDATPHTSYSDGLIKLTYQNETVNFWYDNDPILPETDCSLSGPVRLYQKLSIPGIHATDARWSCTSASCDWRSLADVQCSESTTHVHDLNWNFESGFTTFTLSDNVTHIISANRSANSGTDPTGTHWAHAATSGNALTVPFSIAFHCGSHGEVAVGVDADDADTFNDAYKMTYGTVCVRDTNGYRLQFSEEGTLTYSETTTATIDVSGKDMGTMYMNVDSVEVAVYDINGVKKHTFANTPDAGDPYYANVAIKHDGDAGYPDEYASVAVCAPSTTTTTTTPTTTTTTPTTTTPVSTTTTVPQCPLGQYHDQADGSCSDCPVGKYNPYSYGNSTHVHCTGNGIDGCDLVGNGCSGTKPPEQCRQECSNTPSCTGYTMNDGWPPNIPDGWCVLCNDTMASSIYPYGDHVYQHNKISDNVCINCPAGKYQDQPGQTFCATSTTTTTTVPTAAPVTTTTKVSSALGGFNTSTFTPKAQNAYTNALVNNVTHISNATIDQASIQDYTEPASRRLGSVRRLAETSALGVQFDMDVRSTELSDKVLAAVKDVGNAATSVHAAVTAAFAEEGINAPNFDKIGTNSIANLTSVSPTPAPTPLDPAAGPTPAPEGDSSDNTVVIISAAGAGAFVLIVGYVMWLKSRRPMTGQPPPGRLVRNDVDFE